MVVGSSWGSNVGHFCYMPFASELVSLHRKTRVRCSSLTSYRCIHIYFIVKETGLFFFIGRMFSSPKCPHCSRDLRLLWDMSSNGSVDSKNSYVAVRNEEVEADPSMEESLPRPSTDDETARLV